MTVFTITPGRRLDQAIRWASGRPGGAGFNVLLTAVEAGRIGLTLVMHRRVAWTPRSLKSTLSNVVMIGDDAGNSRNPDEWRCAISAIAWARSAIVHGTGAQAWHYAEAVRGTEATGRCLFVETDSAHAAAWASAIAPRGIPALTLIPPPGVQHPVMSARGAAH